MKEMLGFLDSVPLRYREGRWSLLAHAGVLSIAVWIGLNYREAQQSYLEDVLPEIDSLPREVFGSMFMLHGLRGVVGLFFFLFMSACLLKIGPWPLVSYTVSSWNVLTLRCMSAFFAGMTTDPTVAVIARSLKFPALVMNTITVTIWWTVLVPVIYYLIKSKEGKEGFMKFNFSTFLLHIHGLNLPVAIYEFLASSAQGEALHFYDLYCSVVFSFIYMVFYLNILDPAGIQIYVVFTPRTHWAIVTYISVFFIHLGVYHGALHAAELYKAAVLL